jgi:hypothetical protein
MQNQLTPMHRRCPPACRPLVRQLHETLDRLIDYCLHCRQSFGPFEQGLLELLNTVGQLLVLLFLHTRHHALDLRPWQQQGRYRVKDRHAERTLDTRYGPVRYARAYLTPTKQPGPGFHPLDIALGLTRDGFSPGVIQLVTRLATRMSYQAAARVCRYFLGWSPSTEAIEAWVLGLGRYTQAFMDAVANPTADGEVLIIEVDGKCTPTATAAELAKRRGPRAAKHGRGCPCRCQRHRGQQRRRAGGRKKRRKKGDKSKNGREITLVVMYTLRRDADGRLHGPLNKKVWGTYAGRKAASLWARAQATKRGFPPDTTKQVEIVLDGVKSLYQGLVKLFPQAWFTLDIRHVEEKLWQAGRHFHSEGSPELQAWVQERQAFLYRGQAKVLIERLQEDLGRVSLHGPGTKARRQGLRWLLNYLEPRLPMMRYDELIAQDLVIASGIVEGAARYVVGERLDGAGMRWIQERAQALLQLRCIELNGDWDRFFRWSQEQWCEDLRNRRAVQIRSDQPIQLSEAA